MGHQIRPRVFLDSNVLFSALYSPGGAPDAILTMFGEGRIRVVVSRQVLEEAVRAVQEKLPKALHTLSRLLMNIHLEVVEDPSLSEFTRWAAVIHRGDAPILAAAVAAQVDYLVTGDNHFFQNPAIVEKTGLQIVTPAQFLACLEEEG